MIFLSLICFACGIGLILGSIRDLIHEYQIGNFGFICLGLMLVGLGYYINHKSRETFFEEYRNNTDIYNHIKSKEVLRAQRLEENYYNKLIE